MANKRKVLTPSVLVQVLVFVVLVPCLPLLISWRWGWWEAWVYALIGILGFAVSRFLAARRHPDLLAERARFMRHEDTKSWDQLLARLVGLGGAFIPLVAGLDARYGWTGQEFGLVAKLVALALIAAGFAIGSWALMENRFFSGVVRIQVERGHHVVTTGPYRWVRHPGYAGALLDYWLTPIFLDSLWTFIPVAALTVVLVVRTALEDRVLQAELPGYREYASKTPFRLLPGIW